MKVILLEDVKAQGKKGQIVEVSDAYGRNVLIAKKLGVEATPKALNDLKLQKKHEEKVAQEQYEAAVELGKVIETKKVTYKIEEYEDKRIVWVKACRNYLEEQDEDDEENKTIDITLEKINKILKKIDHMMIFVLIAGSYTPVCMLILEHDMGYLLLAAVWGIALVGILIKFFWVTCPKWFSSMLYIDLSYIKA